VVVLRTSIDTLDRIGIFAVAVVARGLAAPGQFKKKARLVFVSYGSRENGTTGKANVEALKQAGINGVFYESPQTGHEWALGDVACTSLRRCCSSTDPLRFQV